MPEMLSGAAGQAPGGPLGCGLRRTSTELSIVLHSHVADRSEQLKKKFLEPLWNLFECPVSGAKKMKKNQEVKSMACVVPQEGFEPPTPSLRMMCSTD
jgi:hypothetical protein